MTFPTQYNNLDSRQLYTPPSAPTRHTSRTYTVSRPSSLPVAGLPSRPSTTSRFSFHDAYSDRGVRRSGSAAEGTTVSMDDVYAVDDALAKRQSLQPPAYAPGNRLPGYSDDKIIPPEKTNDLTRHTRNNSVSSENAEPSQQMSMITRIVIPLLLVLPVLTAMGLSYFGTSQSDSIRGVVDVVHVRLPLAEFRKLQRPEEAAPLVLGPGPLISTPVVSQSQLPAFTLSASQRALGEVGEASATQDVLSVPSAKSQVARRQNRDDSDGGTLAIGLWGWSLTPVDGTSTLLSPPQVWDQLYDLFPDVDNSTQGKDATAWLTRADFPLTLGRMLFLHSVGLLLTMVATVPLLIYVFRKHVRNNAFVNPGWLQHGSLIAATTCHYAAWIIDKKYTSAVRNNVRGRYTVSSGVLPTLTLSSAALLSVATLASTLPIFVAFLKRQQSRSRQWTSVMEVTGGANSSTYRLVHRSQSGSSSSPRRQASVRPSRADQLRPCSYWSAEPVAAIFAAIAVTMYLRSLSGLDTLRRRVKAGPNVAQANTTKHKSAKGDKWVCVSKVRASAYKVLGDQQQRNPILSRSAKRVRA